MSIYNVREHTAKTVNQELHSLAHSCKRIQARLDATTSEIEMGGAFHLLAKERKLKELLARQQATLDAAIVAAKEGRTWRHRGQIAHMNKGIAKAKVKHGALA